MNILLKTRFWKWKITITVITVNTTNFISSDSIDFAKTWVFEHLTS